MIPLKRDPDAYVKAVAAAAKAVEQARTKP
jgi:hypothetical protein